MSSLKKRVYAKMATVESCGFTRVVECRCDHQYCSCGSDPSAYVAADKLHYWSDESSAVRW
ncbi:MAG: hypothetical protein HFI16_04075 [Lachnospiraceae bacterium]|nr:hypothetical protein [Lachnospiraceae bacterium]